MLREKNNLVTKIAMLSVVMFAVGVSNLFAGELMFVPTPVWSNYLVDTLGEGDSKTVTIRANESHNYTDIRLVEGRKYKFTVASPEWNNGSKETTAAGYNTDAPYANMRRHPEYRMMELVGELFSQNGNPLAYTGKAFKIGMGREYTAAVSGWLIAFANDCLPCYVDNSRVVTLTVKRLN